MAHIGVSSTSHGDVFKCANIPPLLETRTHHPLQARDNLMQDRCQNKRRQKSTPVLSLISGNSWDVRGIALDARTKYSQIEITSRRPDTPKS